jgi:heptosyltransferase-2
LSFEKPKLYLQSEEIQTARELLMSYGVDFRKHRVIGINPGAAYGTAKCWLPERYQGLVKRFLEDPHTYIIFFVFN